MNVSVARLLYGVGIILLLSGCNRTPLSQERVQLNVLSTVPLGTEKSFESSVYCKLLLPLPAPAPKSNCATGYAVNMNVLFLRSNQKIDLNPKLEKKNDKTVYQAALNEVTAQFKTFQFPENFFQPDTSQAIEARLATVLKGNSDSVLVLTDKKQLNLWKEKKYLVFTDVESMRYKLIEMICRSKQMSFTILVEPPMLSTPSEPQPPVLPPTFRDPAPIKDSVKKNVVTAPPTPIKNTTTIRANTGGKYHQTSVPSTYQPAPRTEPTIIINTQPVNTSSSPAAAGNTPMSTNSTGKPATFDKRFDNSKDKDKVETEDAKKLGKQNR